MRKFVAAMIILLIVGAVLTGIGCAIFFSSGDSAFGKEIQYTEHVYDSPEAFNTVSFDLKFIHKFVFVRGETYKVKYSDAEKFPITVTSNNNGTVSVKESDGGITHWWQKLLYKHTPTVIEITVPNDVVLSLNGTIDGISDTVLPSWEYGNVDLKMRGSSDIKGYNVKIADLKLNVSGSTELELTGEFQTIKVDASGSAKLDLSGNANSLNASASGSVEVECENFNCPAITVSASGSAEFDLSGTGGELNVKASGSTEISARYFSLKKAVFDVSGSIDAEVSVSETLSVKASGSADINYWGDPTVDKQISGSATVRKMG